VLSCFESNEGSEINGGKVQEGCPEVVNIGLRVVFLLTGL